MTSLQCTYCNRVCKSKGGLTHHRKSCEKKHNTAESSASGASTSTAEVPHTPERRYFHKNIHKYKSMKSFIADVAWDELAIHEDKYVEFCTYMASGIIDLFVFLHNSEHHDNIQWHHDKLVAFDGKGWTEVDDKMLSLHLGFIFAILEEKWCDYQMNIRCGIQESSLSEDVTSSIDEFFYDTIVDDDSLLFHCCDLLFEYLETMKS